MTDTSVLAPEEERARAADLGLTPQPPTGLTAEDEAAIAERLGLVRREPESATIGQRVVQRFLGTDIEDRLELPRLGSIVGGSISGGVAGSRTPTLPGPAGLAVNPLTGALTGGAVGAIAGAMAPEGAMELGEDVGLLPEGTREAEGLSPEELRTVAEGEALLELATGGGLTALRLAGRGASRLFAGGGKGLAETAARQGIHLMPVQVGDRTLARGFVTVFGRFPIIATPLRKSGQAAEAALEKAITDVPNRVGPLSSMADVSERIFKDARTLVKETNAQFGRRYEALFDQADELGVSIVPRETLAKADEILNKLATATPATVTGKASPGPALAAVTDFIEESILPMRTAGPDATVFANQSLRQMDGVVSKIDQQIASLEPGQRKFAMSQLIQLRQAAQRDALANVRGANGDEIARGLRELDTEFAQTMASVFETSTGKRFQSVRRRGLRGVAADEATRVPVDQLARVVLNLKSPQAIEELSRLAKPETMQRLTAQVLDDAVTSSMSRTGDGLQFNVETFAKQLGIGGAGTERRAVMEALLAKSGGALSIADLEELVTVGRAISSLEIPSVSAFIARRAGIGGIKSAINGLVPGLAVAGGAGLAGGVTGLALFVGGGRLLSSIIANPTSARAFSKVLDKEATTLVRRKAAVEAIRIGLADLRSEGLTPKEVFPQLLDISDLALEALFQQIDSLQEN